MLKKFNHRKTWMLPAVNAVLGLFFHEKKYNTPVDFQNAKQVLVIDYALIGDSVMSTSFLRIIKKNIPKGRLTLVCSELEKEILDKQGIVDEFITIRLEYLTDAAGTIKNHKYIVRTAEKINQKSYDIAIEPRGDIRFIYLMHLCNAKRKISYNYTGGECFLTDVIKPSDEVSHVVEDKLYLLKRIGMTFSKEEAFPKLDKTEEGKAYAQKFIRKHGISDKFLIGMHPGASVPIRNWKHYPKLLKLLNIRMPEAAFLIFEGPKEKETAALLLEAAEKAGAAAVRVRKKIKDYMNLIGSCDIVICNDSGAGHMAAAMGVKTYVIFGPALPEEVRPYKESGVYCFSFQGLSCKPCRAGKCRHHGACLEGIKAEDVCRKIMETMNTMQTIDSIRKKK